MKEKPDRVCPLCDGMGFIKKSRFDKKKDDIKKLISEGFSYRYIADLLRIKSVSTIHYYAKRK